MQKHGPPISRGFVSDERLVTQLLDPVKPTREHELLSILVNERGWTRKRAKDAITKAQVNNTIRWVAFEGWCAGGRP